MYRYPLAASTWDSAELEAAVSVLESGHSRWASVSHHSNKRLRYVGRKLRHGQFRVVCQSSCSRLSSLSAPGPLASGRRGDSAGSILVDYYSPLHQYGLRIRFVDIDSETLNYDLEALADSITARTRMVVAVDLLGNPNDFDAIDSIIAGRDIVLLEDSQNRWVQIQRQALRNLRPAGHG